MTGVPADTSGDVEVITVHRLKYAALTLALLTAGVHLFWGIPRFVNYLSVGVMPDPRPLLFVLSGHAVVVGVTLVGLGLIDARRTYLPGIVLMLAHVVGYVGWHTVYSHGLSNSHSHATEAFQVGNVVAVVIDHLINSPIALVSKLAEVAVIGLLATLYVAAWRH